MRRFGSGPALVLIHGFPVHGYTWRALLPELAERHTCFVLDLPGLGDSDWNDATDFSFTGQARRLSPLLRKLGIDRFALLAHDTGATVARLLALAEPARVARLAIINTEIPGHRPPWIPLYQKLTRVPGAGAVFHVLLQQQWFVRSGMGFREFYSDRRLFDDPARLAPYLDPVLASPQRMRGMLLYLRGPEWSAVDALRTRHAEIKCPVLLLWGEDDETFPAARRRADAGAVRRADDVRADSARVADAARRATRRRARVAAAVPGGPLTMQPDADGFLERFRAFGAQPDVARYLALFDPDATLFDSGMERPITVPEIPEHIEGDPEAGARLPHDARTLAAARRDDLRRGAQPGDAARRSASSGRRST